MKRANTMSTITVELTIKVKTKFIPSNAETNGFISPQMSNFTFEALQGLPRPARGTRTKRGSRGLESIYYGVRLCVTAKLPVLGPWFWNLICSILRPLLATYMGRFWRQQVPSPLWWRNLLQVLVRKLNHFKQQRRALRQASQLCCFGLQMQFAQKPASIWMIVLNTLLPLVGPPCPL